MKGGGAELSRSFDLVHCMSGGFLQRGILLEDVLPSAHSSSHSSPRCAREHDMSLLLTVYLLLAAKMPIQFNRLVMDSTPILPQVFFPSGLPQPIKRALSPQSNARCDSPIANSRGSTLEFFCSPSRLCASRVPT